MTPRSNRPWYWNGSLYVPFHSALLAAGPFLPFSNDSFERYLELPPEHEFRLHVRDHYVGGHRTHRRFLSAARISGDSMTGLDIRHGDVVILQHAEFGDVESGKIVLVERLGEQEGEGAWTLKRLIVERPRSWRRNEFGDEIGSDDPDVVLRSDSQHIHPWHLEPSGRHRVRGVFLRSLRPDSVRLIDAELIGPATERKSDVLR